MNTSDSFGREHDNNWNQAEAENGMTYDPTKAEKFQSVAADVEAILQRDGTITANVSGQTGIPEGLGSVHEIALHFLAASEANQRRFATLFASAAKGEGIQQPSGRKQRSTGNGDASSEQDIDDCIVVTDNGDTERYRNYFEWASGYRHLPVTTLLRSRATDDLSERAIRDGHRNHWQPVVAGGNHESHEFSAADYERYYNLGDRSADTMREDDIVETYGDGNPEKVKALRDGVRQDWSPPIR